jgi:hypothetical protein
MEYVHILQIISKIFPFVGTKDTKGKVEQCPEMDGFPCMVVNIGHIMDLGVAVMTRRDAIGCLGSQDLVGLSLAIGPSLLLESGLEESPAAAAAKIIGFIGCHVHKVFRSDHGLNHISHVVGNGITISLSDQLTGILEGKFDLTLLIPVRRGFKLTFPDPLGIELNDTFNLKVVGDVEFFQSCQDCKEFVPSLGV